MLSLLIETCTEQSLIALFEGEACLYEYRFPEGIREMHQFVPKVQEALKICRKNVGDLAYLAVGRGPGSYTGTRIGVVVAQALSFAQQIPLVSFLSLEAFIPDEEGSFAVLFDAKMGEVHVLMGEKRQGEVIYQGIPEYHSLDVLKNRLEKVSRLICPEGSSFKTKIEAQAREMCIPCLGMAPNALHLHRIAEEKYLRGEYTIGKTVQIFYPSIIP